MKWEEMKQEKVDKKRKREKGWNKMKDKKIVYVYISIFICIMYSE